MNMTAKKRRISSALEHWRPSTKLSNLLLTLCLLQKAGDSFCPPPCPRQAPSFQFSPQPTELPRSRHGGRLWNAFATREQTTTPPVGTETRESSSSSSFPEDNSARPEETLYRIDAASKALEGQLIQLQTLSDKFEQFLMRRQAEDLAGKVSYASDKELQEAEHQTAMFVQRMENVQKELGSIKRQLQEKQDEKERLLAEIAHQKTHMANERQQSHVQDQSWLEHASMNVDVQSQPIQQPIQNPIQHPIQQQEQPRDQTIQEPVQQLVQNPMQQPIQQPEQPRQQPIQQVVPIPIQQPIQQPEQPRQQPIQQLVQNPIQQAVQQPIQQPELSRQQPKQQLVQQPVQQRQETLQPFSSLTDLMTPMPYLMKIADKISESSSLGVQQLLQSPMQQAVQQPSQQPEHSRQEPKQQLVQQPVQQRQQKSQPFSSLTDLMTPKPYLMNIANKISESSSMAGQLFGIVKEAAANTQWPSEFNAGDQTTVATEQNEPKDSVQRPTKEVGQILGIVKDAVATKWPPEFKPGDQLAAAKPKEPKDPVHPQMKEVGKALGIFKNADAAKWPSKFIPRDRPTTKEPNDPVHSQMKEVGKALGIFKDAVATKWPLEFISRDRPTTAKQDEANYQVHPQMKEEGHVLGIFNDAVATKWPSEFNVGDRPATAKQDEVKDLVPRPINEVGKVLGMVKDAVATKWPPEFNVGDQTIVATEQNEPKDSVQHPIKEVGQILGIVKDAVAITQWPSEFNPGDRPVVIAEQEPTDLVPPPIKEVGKVLGVVKDAVATKWPSEFIPRDRPRQTARQDEPQDEPKDSVEPPIKEVGTVLGIVKEAVATKWPSEFNLGDRPVETAKQEPTDSVQPQIKENPVAYKWPSEFSLRDRSKVNRKKESKAPAKVQSLRKLAWQKTFEIMPNVCYRKSLVSLPKHIIFRKKLFLHKNLPSPIVVPLSSVLEERVRQERMPLSTTNAQTPTFFWYIPMKASAAARRHLTEITLSLSIKRSCPFYFPQPLTALHRGIEWAQWWWLPRTSWPQLLEVDSCVGQFLRVLDHDRLKFLKSHNNNIDDDEQETSNPWDQMEIWTLKDIPDNASILSVADNARRAWNWAQWQGYTTLSFLDPLQGAQSYFVVPPVKKQRHLWILTQDTFRNKQRYERSEILPWTWDELQRETTSASEETNTVELEVIS